MTNTPEATSEGAAILAHYHRLYTSVLNVLRGFSDEELNWQPPTQEMNTPYQIAYHAASSSLWWVNVAQGHFIERDRESEFSAHGALLILENALKAWIAAAEQIIPTLTSADYDKQHMTHHGTCTGRWALLHVIDHLSLHLGQLEITHQWFEQEQRRNQIY